MKNFLGLLSLTVCALFVITGCSNKDGVKIGDTVSISYTASFSDGTTFEQRTEKTPLTFVVGSGDIIQGLSQHVIGMKIAQSKKFTLAPGKGYGKFYSKNNIQKISQLIFDQLNIQATNGSTQKLGNIEGVIKGTEKDDKGNSFVLFDINPRQTWDILKYRITVLSKK